ncbi:MAG: 2-amino-4-hydroxy-6-hydroxymethyldihydropteridine diphosphokinase [Thermoguttaceae bacterium]
MSTLKTMPFCLIGLGSNQGNRQATLDAAVDGLAAHPQIRLLARSAWHETKPIGGPAQADYLNGAVTVETSLAPAELLGCLQRIENGLGRRRDERWGPRTIDLDLLLYDRLICDTPTLVLPHPRMALRRFVLEPAAEVASDMLHPTTGWTVSRLLEHLNQSPRYIAIAGSIGAGKTNLAERLATTLGGRIIAEQPDWRQLDAFYDDPARHAWETESAFLEHRARLLAEDFVADGPWSISDFWFGQSAAFARVWLPPERFALFLERERELHSAVARPRLIVLLTASADVLQARVAERGRCCERRLTAEQLGRIQQSVIEQTAHRDVGPVLGVSGEDPAAAFAEALAAIRGME